MSTESELATAALDTLHGARQLLPKQAASELRVFLNSISSPVTGSEILARASAALTNLVSKLEADGAATDDDCQEAIESMNSLANEAS